MTPTARDAAILQILRASNGSHDFTDSPFEFEFREAAKAMRGRVKLEGKVLKLKEARKKRRQQRLTLSAPAKVVPMRKRK